MTVAVLFARADPVLNEGPSGPEAGHGLPAGGILAL